MVTRRPNAVIAISIVLAGAILAIAVWLLAQMREDALRRAQDAVFNVSLLVERDVSRNLEIYDLSLRAVIDGLRHPGVLELPPVIRQMVLFDGSIGAKDMGSVFVLDKNGNVRFDSRSVEPRPLNFAGRDFFKVQRDSPNVGLFISHPFSPGGSGTEKDQDKDQDKDMRIALSRRISQPDGSFGGVVVGTMRLTYFRHLFDGMKLGPSGSMALMLSDGTMLMRRPYDPKTIGINLTGTANYSRFIRQPNGDFFGTAAIDGVERWYAFSHIDIYPLILDVALSTGDIYVEWRRRAWIIGTLIAGLDVTIIALAILFSYQLRRRREAEEELRELARTDGLTGLNNRRAFEEEVNEEWRRAQRNGWPLSLLLIDVDYFKGFNDLYGHSAGDEALIGVARCITQNVRRPGDTAARYGGEEFAVLLPDTGAAGAQRIAEQIRTAVQALECRHVASTHHVLTVSVGAATAHGPLIETSRALINAADEALYRAKDAGRNRVQLYRAAEGAPADGAVVTPDTQGPGTH
ncbi:sensor domain-containing diguanylate cyclase [Paraburkholderia susongensis]|uniref:diguanylate cyclase n=1 Tax=Paraburkholderia susongensis TaxID=1515439 RepID=A0A1X7K0B5_9BURK|nr:sensor domain-containing diguanylate cyclase [Paraburkholderia susongensis]SMG34048.1 diguanylate cyclase (GGDEF) domain-containing protein [Paraburkholderia susongensis]